MSRARVDDNDRGLKGADRDIVGGADAHERIIGRALERAAVAQDFHREVQNMRRSLGRLRDVGVSPLVQGFYEEDAAVRRVPPIFRGCLEQRGTLRHHMLLVGRLNRRTFRRHLLGTAPLSRKRSRAFLTIVKACPNPRSHYCDIRVTKDRETFMQAISRFVRTTIFGGVLFLTPIVVIWFILSKAYNLAGRVLLPLTALIPESLSTRTTITVVLEVLVIALACFLAGLFARTMRAQMIVRELEVSVLSKVPGYEYMKQAGASMLGVGETADYPVILANLGGAWRIGVQTDVLGENLVAVFVPNSPNPLSGGVFLIAADRVRPAGVSLAAAMGALRRCGTGSGTLFTELAVVGPT